MGRRSQQVVAGSVENVASRAQFSRYVQAHGIWRPGGPDQFRPQGYRFGECWSNAATWARRRPGRTYCEGLAAMPAVQQPDVAERYGLDGEAHCHAFGMEGDQLVEVTPTYDAALGYMIVRLEREAVDAFRDAAQAGLKGRHCSVLQLVLSYGAHPAIREWLPLIHPATTWEYGLLGWTTRGP